jgi:hypothetical protein
VKHSVSNGKRPVSNVNKRAKMFAVCAWTQIAVSYILNKTLAIKAFTLAKGFAKYLRIQRIRIKI